MSHASGRAATMRGSIRELRPGYWQVRFYVGRDPLTGRSRYISRGVAGKRRDAERLANQLAATITKQRHHSGVHTMAELWDDWLAHLAAIGRSPTTLRGYRQKLDVMAPYLGHHQVAAVTPKLIDSLYQRLLTRTYRGRPATPSLVASYHRVLSSSLAQAVRWGMIDSNPAARATPPTAHRRRMRAPGHDEVLAVLEEAGRSRNPELLVAFRLAAVTGARRGELCALRWGDVDGAVLRFERAVIVDRGALVEKATKTGESTPRTVDDVTANLLVTHRSHQEAVARSLGAVLAADAFVLADLGRDPTGGVPWRPDRLSQAHRRIVERLNVPHHRFHDLRHYHASLLIEAGLPLTVVADRLGHASPAVTSQVYAHMLARPDAAVVAAVTRALPGYDETPPPG